MPEQTSAAQLERILYILPVAARADGVSTDELARALGVETNIVLRELEQVMARAYYHPAGSVDAFTVSIEHDRVQIHAPSEFLRPVRLNAREALALGLGLRGLAAEAEAPRRAELLALAQRLERELQAPEHGLQPRTQQQPAGSVPAPDEVSGPPLKVELEADDFLGVLASANTQNCVCTISYLKPGARSSADRRIAPLLLVYDRGKWYLDAHDQAVNERRMFRLDRILSVRSEQERFDRAATGDAAEGFKTRGFAYHGDEESEIEVRVRYSPRIARWLTEQVAAVPEADGSLILTHRVADPDWLVRHVLQYGEDAEVLEPRSARERVRSCALALSGDSSA